MNKRQYKKQYKKQHRYNPPKLPKNSDSDAVFRIETEDVEIIMSCAANAVSMAFTAMGEVFSEISEACDSFAEEMSRISKGGRYVR